MERLTQLFLITVLIIFTSCDLGQGDDVELDISSEMTATIDRFGDDLSLNEPYNYADQVIPSYIIRDNSADNPIEDKTATLGRVLFYDKALSVDNTVACASCHQQAHAFGDVEVLSSGVNGVTGRHSMRLINARFSEEVQFFWDERADDLEEQTTMPIQDHAEMGFSGTDGDPDFEDLIDKLEAIDYYQELFDWAYGDAVVTEERMQQSLAQFIRSIQSFDSKYDEGRSQVNNENQDFPNFSTLENEGKRLFMAPSTQGGAGCAGCHRAPEFDIDPDSRSNGVFTVAQSPDETDETNTRAPSLRDIFDQSGVLNGPLMHDGSFNSLEAVIGHYNDIPRGGRIDRRLEGQNLNLSNDEIDAMVAFLKTLSGSDVYTNEKWSDPF
jgi:cytochrome c peroxidase